jgi:hypothetical protein
MDECGTSSIFIFIFIAVCIDDWGRTSGPVGRWGRLVTLVLVLVVMLMPA